ncbi:hypothetical protein ACQKP3_14730 [Vibrio sp. DNB22_10_4]
MSGIFTLLALVIFGLFLVTKMRSYEAIGSTIEPGVNHKESSHEPNWVFYQDQTQSSVDSDSYGSTNNTDFSSMDFTNQPHVDDENTVINPATGLPMVGGIGGLDTMGNPYGYDSLFQGTYPDDTSSSTADSAFEADSSSCTDYGCDEFTTTGFDNSCDSSFDDSFSTGLDDDMFS